MELTDETIVSADPKHESGELQGEAVVLNSADGTYYGLSEVAADVWKLVQEPRAMREIVDGVVATYDVDRETCRQDIEEMVRDLLTKGLVRIEDGKTP